jgi:hypothetical protein
MIQVEQIRIRKSRPRRCEHADGENEADVVPRANAAATRARHLSDRLRALARDLDLVLDVQRS